MGKRWKTQKLECDGQGNTIPYKMVFVSATLVKNSIRGCIFSGQSGIFEGGGGKHIVT